MFQAEPNTAPVLQYNGCKNLYVAIGKFKGVWKCSHKTDVETFYCTLDLLLPGQEISGLMQQILN